MKNNTVILLMLTLSLMVNSCKKDEDKPITPAPSVPVENGLTLTDLGSLTFNINHVFGNSDLELAPKSYPTAAQDTIRITQLSYYITNIILTNKAGGKINLGNAHLVNFLPPSKSEFTIDGIPAGVYTSISYNIGVDSMRNSTGLQEGDLDPSNGMFWTWNTGYVFVRCKGRFSYSETAFSLDIGGTRNLMTNTHSLTSFTKTGASALLKLNMDMETFFNTPNTYDFKMDSYDIHTTGSPSIVKLKPNIMASFTLKNVQ